MESLLGNEPPCDFNVTVTGVAQPVSQSGHCSTSTEDIFYYSTHGTAYDVWDAASVSASRLLGGSAHVAGVPGSLTIHGYAETIAVDSDYVSFQPQPGAAPFTSIVVTGFISGSFSQTAADTGSAELRVVGGLLLDLDATAFGATRNVFMTGADTLSLWDFENQYEYQIHPGRLALYPGLHVVAGTNRAPDGASFDRYTDFTGGIQSIALLDGASDVTSQYQIVSTSGRDYATPMTATPEPATTSLVAAGLLGLGASARRRRRA